MKKYKVVVSDGRVLDLYRRWYDFWWFDTGSMYSFRNANGNSIKIGKHWVITIEEVE